jgi:hypothetical protein
VRTVPLGPVSGHTIERASATATGSASAPGSATAPDDDGGAATFEEGTQALLDRLERLADMRDRGLLGEDESETAKEAVMRELERRA